MAAYSGTLRSDRGCTIGAGISQRSGRCRLARSLRRCIERPANDQLVMLSVQFFMLTLVFLGSLNNQLRVCLYSSAGDILPGQDGCYNLQPVFSWIKRCIISIFLVFWIAFVPLFVQELTERGTGRAILRLCKHFLSLSPVFEVFSTQIYMHSILNNLTFGGARYIATGRGFATTRISFSIL